MMINRNHNNNHKHKIKKNTAKLQKLKTHYHI